MNLLISQPVPQVPTDVISNTSKAIIDNGGLLGALLILSVLINVLLGWVVIRVQNARVKDTERIMATSEKMVETFAGVQNTLSNLNEAARSQAAAMNTILLQAITRPSGSKGGG